MILSTQRIRAGLQLGVLLFVVAATAQSKETAVDIRAIFSASDFIPHVPTMAAVKAEFPEGSFVTSDGEKFFVSRVSTDRWVAFHFDSELADRYSGVSEIEYLNWAPTPLAKKFTPQAHSKVVSMGDFIVGDSVQKVIASRRNLRVSNARKYGSNIRVYEFSPRPSEADLYARIYVKAGVIVGFSLGVTE